MLKQLKMLVILLTIPLLCSCQNSVQAQESSLENKLAYAHITKVKHTKHVRKQQRKICDRLKKIKERLEKRKKKRDRK